MLKMSDEEVIAFTEDDMKLLLKTIDGSIENRYSPTAVVPTGFKHLTRSNMFEWMSKNHKEVEKW